MPGPRFSFIIQNMKWNSYVFGLASGIGITIVMSISIGLIVSPHLSDNQSGGEGNEPGIKIARLFSGTKQNNCIPVDGHWSDWLEVGSCSVTCGKGVIALVRECSNPYPYYGGNVCEGNHFGFGICSRQMCEKDNIALGKSTRQSSYYVQSNSDKFGPGLAVDGERSAGSISKGYMCTHTKNEYQPWWAVDLGAEYSIEKVIIFGRTDCCEGRLSQFDIDAIMPKVSSKSSQWNSIQDGTTSRCYYQHNPVPGFGLNASCKSSTLGRYLRIKLRRRNPLTLCEVKVYGSLVFDKGNLLKLESLDYHHSLEYRGPVIQVTNATDDSSCNATCSTMSGCKTFKFSNERQQCISLM